jgi:hypothetical protein
MISFIVRDKRKPFCIFNPYHIMINSVRNSLSPSPHFASTQIIISNNMENQSLAIGYVKLTRKTSMENK